MHLELSGEHVTCADTVTVLLHQMYEHDVIYIDPTIKASGIDMDKGWAFNACLYKNLIRVGGTLYGLGTSSSVSAPVEHVFCDGDEIHSIQQSFDMSQ